MAPSGCTDLMPATRTTNSCVRHAARGGRRQPINAGSARARSLSPSRHPLLPTRRTASRTTCSLWRASRPGCLGAAGPGGTRAQADRNLVDGTILGRAPPKTDTAEEVVPLNRRVDIRQEILSMEADDEALKVRERQEVKVKVQRSLQEAEAQSFQLYHPQVDQAIRKKEELHKALREHREPTPEESLARQRHKELVTDEMLDGEMAILAPLQEGREPGPSGRSTCSDSRPSCKISTWRVRVSTPARHWLMRWARRRRRTSAPRTPTRHGCLTTPSSRTRGTRRHRPPPRVPLAPGGTSQCNRRTWTWRRVSCP